MKHNYSYFLYLITFILFMSGCVKDKCERTSTYIQKDPIYMDYDEFRANVAAVQAKPLKNPGKIYIKNQFLFINEVREGIHIYDLSDPNNPKNVSFIEIMGNLDMAVKGNVLYADSFMDVIALDISDPLNVNLVKRIENVFPVDWNRDIVFDESGVVVDWIETEVTEEVDCINNRGRNGGVFWNMPQDDFVTFQGNLDGDFSSAPTSAVMGEAGNGASQTGTGGSFARFTISGNHLYAIDKSQLYPFDISNSVDPVYLDNPIYVGWNIETVFPYKNNLFFGSQSGMFIYSLADPIQPIFVAEFSHAQACDPVVVENDIAYVTLRDGNACNGFQNQLDVIDVSNLNNPTLLRSYEMSNPHGLGIENGTLFVCDGPDGLKIYDAENPSELEEIEHYQSLIAVDVIPFQNHAFLIGEEGFVLYDYSDLNNITKLGTIPVEGN